MGFFFGSKKARAARKHRKAVQARLVAHARAGAIQGATQHEDSPLAGILLPYDSIPRDGDQSTFVLTNPSAERLEDRYTRLEPGVSTGDGPNLDMTDASLPAEAPISYPSEPATPSHSCSSPSSDSSANSCSSGSSSSCGGASSCGGGGGGGD